MKSRPGLCPSWCLIALPKGACHAYVPVLQGSQVCVAESWLSLAQSMLTSYHIADQSNLSPATEGRQPQVTRARAALNADCDVHHIAAAGDRGRGSD